jgi:ATP adenylyltransferase
MSFDNLWAGWRSAYVASVSNPESEAVEAVDDGVDSDDEAHCVFCRIVKSAAPDEERHVLFESEFSIVIMNAYPYATGHVLAMPRRHEQELSGLSAVESADLWSVTTVATRAIEAAYHPDGMNLGANLGRAAGAGIPRHLHLHVLPRWVGDTNFMTAIASVRVMPEALSDSFKKLRASWPR